MPLAIFHTYHFPPTNNEMNKNIYRGLMGSEWQKQESPRTTEGFNNKKRFD